MKSSLILVFLLFNITVIFAQDKIIRTNKQIINCKITAVDSLKVSFEMEQGGQIRQTSISMDQVVSYEYGTGSIIINKSSQTTPGDELMKYSNEHYLGFGLQAGGLVVLLGGSMLESNPTIFGGGLIILTGIIAQFQSHRHIGKAGRMMNEERYGKYQAIRIKPTRKDIGIALAF